MSSTTGGQVRQDAEVDGHAVSEDMIMQTSKQTQRIEAMTCDELMAQRDRMFIEEPADSDFLAESLLDNMNASPLGKLLKVIGTLPEVRYEKVERGRRLVDQPDSAELDAQMDVALDRVLEELMTEV